MKLDREPDQVEEYVPDKCKKCPQFGQCKMKCCDTRYEYEVQVDTKLIAHKEMGCICPSRERDPRVIFRQEIPEASNTVQGCSCW